MIEILRQRIADMLIAIKQQHKLTNQNISQETTTIGFGTNNQSNTVVDNNVNIIQPLSVKKQA